MYTRLAYMAGRERSDFNVEDQAPQDRPQAANLRQRANESPPQGGAFDREMEMSKKKPPKTVSVVLRAEDRTPQIVSLRVDRVRDLHVSNNDRDLVRALLQDALNELDRVRANLEQIAAMWKGVTAGANTNDDPQSQT